MASDEFVDATIANLKVIGMVPQNGRLCVRKGQLCLEATDNTQSVRRWVRGDSRDLSLMHVRNTISNATRIMQLLCSTTPSTSSHVPPSSTQGEHVDPATSNLIIVGSTKKKWTVRRIAEELAQCEVGLQNLMTTYMTDSIMVANIGVIIERIQEQLGGDPTIYRHQPSSSSSSSRHPQPSRSPQPQVADDVSCNTNDTPEAIIDDAPHTLNNAPPHASQTVNQSAKKKHAQQQQQQQTVGVTAAQ